MERCASEHLFTTKTEKTARLYSQKNRRRQQWIYICIIFANLKKIYSIIEKVILKLV